MTITKNQTQEVENLIRQDYFNLWNKTEKSPFVPGDMEKIYLNSEELVIIDPDFQMLDDQLNTRQCGFDNIFPLLTSPWDFIQDGGIKSLDTVELTSLGSNVMASIEAKGTLNFKDGNTHHLDRKATQIWKQLEDDRWVIAYEHVS
ncbi:MAG: hypothetical protein KI790_06465 [Cyclobacteriaceae bacterium]|nr:hypothetical protein [Cyclobacteriaceae bacterium HetDA_MAG_MS6]